jgi:hypothetical protein
MGHAVRDKSTARCWICPRVHAPPCAFPGTLDKPSRLFRPKHLGPTFSENSTHQHELSEFCRSPTGPSEAARACFPSSAAFTPAPPRGVPGDRSG